MLPHRTRTIARVSALSIVLLSSAPSAQEWSQWRGAGRDGVGSFTEPPKWPDRLILKWKVPVGGGHSSPVVAARRVYLFSRQHDQEVVSSHDLGTGKALWRQSYSAPYRMNPAATRHGPGPKSTPVVHRNRSSLKAW